LGINLGYFKNNPCLFDVLHNPGACFADNDGFVYLLQCNGAHVWCQLSDEYSGHQSVSPEKIATSLAKNHLGRRNTITTFFPGWESPNASPDFFLQTGF
jgi:hypothetical protein